MSRKHFKMRNRPPMSLESVHNISESEICYYHTEIEEFFERHNFSEIEKTFKVEPTLDIYNKICTKWEIDAVRFVKFSQFEEVATKFGICPVYAKDEHCSNLHSYCPLVSELAYLMEGLEDRLYFTLQLNLMRYCVSLQDLCKTELDCVVTYENNLQKYKSQILSELNDINSSMKDFHKLSNNLLLTITNFNEIIDCARKIRASINKLYYNVTEWVNEDRHYLKLIIECLNKTTADRDKAYQKLKAQENSLHQDNTNINSLADRIDNQENELKQHRKNLSICKQRQMYVAENIKALEKHLHQREVSLDRVNRRIDSLEARKKYFQRENRLYEQSPVLNELAHALREKDRVASELVKIVDSQEALERQTERMKKQEIVIRQEISSKTDEISTQKKDLENRKNTHGKKAPVHSSVHEVLYQYDKQIEDLKLLRSKKPDMATLRELYSFGKAISPRKESTPLDQACQFIANHIGVRWHSLYAQLPIKPRRSLAERERDIENIDLICGRRQYGVELQAMMSLKKWRLFYHRGQLSDLVYALKRTSQRDLAAAVETRFKSGNKENSMSFRS